MFLHSLIPLAIALQGATPTPCAAVDPMHNTVVLAHSNHRVSVIHYTDRDVIRYDRPVPKLVRWLVEEQQGQSGRFGCSITRRGTR